MLIPSRVKSLRNLCVLGVSAVDLQLSMAPTNECERGIGLLWQQTSLRSFAQMKKIAIKYGLIITIGAALWVIITHQLVANPQSTIHQFGTPAFFIVLQFVGILLGISEFRRQSADSATFKQLLKTGVWISFVYAITVSLFFAGVMLLVGTRWMAVEPNAQKLPIALLTVQAFTGLFLLSMMFGLAYSTLIAFALAKRLNKAA
jgi:hypothetical protein